VRPSEVAGLVTHLAFYSGWPNAVSALEIIDKVFANRNIARPIATSDILFPLPASDAARAETVNSNVGPVAPKLAELTNDVLFQDLWRRTDLAPRDRSLATIATLAAGGDAAQLDFHLRLGRSNGLTQQEIGEAITHLAFYAGWPKAMAATAAVAKVFAPAQTPETPVAQLTIAPPGIAPRFGPAENFVGAVTVTSPFQSTGDSRMSGATVSFEKGARSNWHVHPLGQLLIVTDGTGWVQAEGEPVRLMKAGDVVWTGPGIKHWHGATRETAMTHVAVAEAKDGSVVTWLEPVSDAQYQGPR
jgi:4-carboxymuconolactone decarboxylase